MSEAQHLADTLVAMFAYSDHGVLTPFTAAVEGLTAEQAVADPGYGCRFDRSGLDGRGVAANADYPAGNISRQA